MRPSDLSTLRGRNGMTEKRDLNRDVGAAVTVLGGVFELVEGMVLSVYKLVAT